MSREGTEAAEPHELSVTEARDHFSERVNRAHYRGEVTFVTRGRRHQRAAAERLADIKAGQSTAVPFGEAMHQIGLDEDELGR